MDWKIFAASATGKSHLARGNPCEDAFHWMKNDGVLVAVVSDGAGSALDSGFGAYHAAKTICEEVLIQFSINPQRPDRKELEFWIKTAIKTARKTLPGVLSDDDLYRYHATIVGVVIFEGMGLFFHIGDGVAVAIQDERSLQMTVSPPENGKSAEQTYFYTQREWYKHLRFTVISSDANLLALMSDGTASFMMDSTQQLLEEAYFKPIDLYLQDVEQAEGDQALQLKLDNPGNDVLTRDDKTLLWARRV